MCILSFLMDARLTFWLRVGFMKIAFLTIALAMARESDDSLDDCSRPDARRSCADGLRTSQLLEQTLRGTEPRSRWARRSPRSPRVSSSPVARDEPIHIDVQLMRCAITNLVGNAVKYSHNESRVTLRGEVANGRALIE